VRRLWWVLVRLKLSLLRAGLATAGIQGRLGLGFAILLGIAFGALGGLGLAALRLLDPADATDAVCGGLGVLLLLWVVGPVVTASADGTIDVDRLAPFPLTRAELIPGLLFGAIAGFGGLVSVLCLAGAFVGMVPASGLAVVTTLAIVLHLFLCAAASRLVGTVISGAARTRRWRDVALIAGPLIAITINVGLQFVSHSLTQSAIDDRFGDLGPLRTTARVVGGPTGLAIGMAREGRAVEALAALLLGGVLLATILYGWAVALERVMTSDGGSRAPASASGIRPLRPRPVAWLLPAGRLGAVAAKELRLVWRDPRQRANLFGTLFGAAVPLFSARFMLATSPSPRLALVAAMPAFILGTQATNQFGYDGPAHWVSVATGHDPRPELLGKNLARLVVSVPAVLLALVVFTARAGDGGFVVPALGLAAAAYGITVGIGNWFSVVSAVALPDSRTNVFSAGNTGQGLAAAGPALATLFGGMLLVSPLAVTMVLVDSRPVLQVLGLVGAAAGFSAWTLGTRATVRHWRPRQPELLALLNERT
jgi:ABC-2 type transport system permease protein